MDTTRFDTATRLFGIGVTRRQASRTLIAGAAILTGSGLVPASPDTVAGKKRRTKKRNKKASCDNVDNVCDQRNWCVDRTQTCGPVGRSGKCLVQAGGGNVCGEILFQTSSCADCEEPSCSDCVCVLAAGGGDRCNNGVDGSDFICVRPV
jgi:hypothetical protein